MTYQYSCKATELGGRDLAIRLLDALTVECICENQKNSIGIAVTEGLNNIVEHALSGCSKKRIYVDLSLNSAQVFVLLQDEGRAMPGWQIPAGRPAYLPVARPDLPEGGFGWTVIHTLADRVDYSRINGVNRLKMWFPSHPK